MKKYKVLDVKKDRTYGIFHSIEEAKGFINGLIIMHESFYPLEYEILEIKEYREEREMTEEEITEEIELLTDKIKTIVKMLIDKRLKQKEEQTKQKE